jgi:hypothetical protein
MATVCRAAAVVLFSIAFLVDCYPSADSSPTSRPSRGPASSDYWNGGYGDWTDTAKWSNGVPDVNTDAFIETGNDSSWVYYNSFAHSLMLGDNIHPCCKSQLYVWGGNLDVATNVDVGKSGFVYVYFGSLTAGGNFTNSGSFANEGQLRIGGGLLNNIGGDLLEDSLTGGTIVVAGSVYNNGWLSIPDNLAVGGDLNNTLRFEVFGTNNCGCNANVTIAGTLANSGTVSIIADWQDSRTATVNTGALVNNGSVNVSKGSDLNLTNQPSGIIDVVSGSSFSINGAFTASGHSAFGNLISIEGSLALGDGGTTTITPGGGTLTVSDTGVLAILNSGTSVNIVGKLVNNGSVDVSSGSVFNLGNQPNGFVDIVAGSSFTINGTFTTNGTFAFSQLATIEGVLSLGNSQTNTVSPNSASLNVSNSGELNVEQGTIFELNGSLSNSGFVSLSDAVVHGSFDNYGSLVSTSSLTVANALTNHLGATFDIGMRNFATNVSASTLVNDGKVFLSGQVNATEFDQLLNGDLQELINGNGSFGRLVIDGPVKLDGTLDITLLKYPTVGTEFKIIEFTPGELTGEFTNINAGYFRWSIAYDNPDGYLSLTYLGTPEPGSVLLLGSGIVVLAKITHRRRVPRRKTSL